MESSKGRIAELGGFQIIEKIGEGGMGVVYKALQKSLDRIVALKVLPPGMAKDVNFVERFEREARAAAKLNHPNIVQIIDVYFDKGLHYLAMEYVDGRSVKEHLEDIEILDETKALDIVKQIALALDCARQANMVHRDIKPDNVLLSSDGTAKLADLGLAKQVSSEDSGLTLEGTTIGTPYYMSPEQASGDKNIDIRSDLYSLGATLFHMVTGRTVFEGDSPAVILVKHINQRPPSAREVNPRVSEDCARLINKLLRKRREARVQTPRELVNQIDAILSGAAPAGRREPSSRRAAETKETGRLFLYGGIAAAIALLLLGTVFLFRRDAPRRPAAPPPKTDGTAVTTAVPPRKADAAPKKPHDKTDDPMKMFEYVREWEKTHRDDYDELIVRYERAKEVAKGTVHEFQVTDRMNEAIAAIRARRSEAAKKVWDTMRDEADKAAAQGNYDGAIAILEKVPPKFAPVIGEKANAKADALKKEVEERIDGAMKKAKVSLEKLEPEKGLRVLAALDRITYASRSGEVAALKQKLAAQKANAAEIRGKVALLKAEKLLENILEKFERTLAVRGDAAAARGIVQQAKRNEELKPLENKMVALGQVADAFEKMSKREREALAKLKGTRVKLKTTTGATVEGTIQRIDGEKILVNVPISGGGSAVMPVSMGDLPEEQKRKLLGDHPLMTAAERVAVALTKLAGNDTAGARELLASVKGFPIAADYLKIVREREIGATEAAAEDAWREVAALAGEKLTKASARTMKTALDVFERNHGETDVCRGKTAKIASLRERANETIVGFSIDKLFKGKVEKFDPRTREIVLFYDWEDPAQDEDWNSPNASARDGFLKGIKQGNITVDLLAPIGEDMEISFDASHIPENHGGATLRGATLSTKKKDSKPGLNLWCGHQNRWEPCTLKPGRKRFGMTIVGRKVSGFVDGKLVVEWDPPRFDPKNKLKQIRLSYGIWCSPEFKGFDNVRIKGILDGEWLKEKLAGR